MFASIDCETGFSTRTSSVPVPFIVPAYTESPIPLLTGIDSPVIAACCTAERPCSTVPSAGSFSPGRTRTSSPATSSRAATVTSIPSRTTTASSGAWSSNPRIAPRVRSKVIACRVVPTENSTTTRAPSDQSPSAAAPTTEIDISTFMSRRRARIAAQADRAIGYPPITIAVRNTAVDNSRWP